MSRATVDLQAVRFFLGYGLIFLTQSALTLLFGGIAMFALQPGLAALSLAPVPFVVLIAMRYGRVARPAHPGGPAADRRADRRRRGERLGRARGQGLRARAAPARALPPLGQARLRPVDVLDAAARLLQPADRLPAADRPRGRSCWSAGAWSCTGQPDARRVHRLLRLRAHADLPHAHARRRARDVPARRRLGRAHLPDPRPRSGHGDPRRTRRRCRTATAASSSATSRCATRAPPSRRCGASRSTSRRAARSRWSGPRPPARRRSSR